MGTSAIFGTIPSGSGNDFPKAAGVPLDPARALDTLFSGGIKAVDVGKLGDRYFINGLGIGLDGAVSHRFKKLVKIPKVLSGTHSGLEEVELRRGPEMEITVERALPAHMDGEPFYLKPGTHKISILPGALKVIATPDAD